MIEVTNEMVRAFIQGYCAADDDSPEVILGDKAERAGLAAVLAIAERDYQMTPRSPYDPRLAARAADPHAHACVTCSPDGVLPGPGCDNCRRTGMDQTPCMEAGHDPQCPHGCCGGPRKSATETYPTGGIAPSTEETGR